MSALKLIPLFLAFGISCSADSVFRFHLLTEPHSLDSQSSSSQSGNYVAQNLFRGLMRFDTDKGLVFEGAESCETKGLTITCRIAKTHRWSDGKPVQAQDYVRSFRRLISPATRSPQAELLLNVKNARAIWKGEKPSSQLGVEAVDVSTLRLTLESPEADFLSKTALPALAPLRSESIPEKTSANRLLVTGPYRISKWKPNDRVILEPNPYYPSKAVAKVEALFIEDDSAALSLYESGTLSLLRRLVTAQIPTYRGRPDFVQVPLSRFDYIGFAPSLTEFPKLRAALSQSLDFDNFRTLFFSLGRPGCPSLPSRLYDGDVCLNFDPSTAKRLYRDEPWPAGIERVLGFSQMGGDDIQRSAEWFQGQWRRNLGLKVELNSQEQVVYLNRLKTDPPALFRKGIGLDRPSCLAGLENFTTESPENYIHLRSKEYDDLVMRLRAEMSPERARAICTSALKILVNGNWIIPLGEIHFTMLASPKFKGWKINSLNQLDLSDLRPVSELH